MSADAVSGANREAFPGGHRHYVYTNWITFPAGADRDPDRCLFISPAPAAQPDRAESSREAHLELSEMLPIGALACNLQRTDDSALHHGSRTRLLHFEARGGSGLISFAILETGYQRTRKHKEH